MEVCANDYWLPVCADGWRADGWQLPEAQVVCRQLGYPTEGQFLQFLSDIKCLYLRM